ncbi:hypothetical protein BGZ76_006395 [Entomortierella beljakovae]|nr:hypothetical protein BGZ76_006395 [Entomortierella beljakovae]
MSPATEATRSNSACIQFHISIYAKALTTSTAKDDAVNTYVGSDAIARRQTIGLNYPIQQGLVTDWNAMQRIWHYTFYNQLRIDPSQHPVLLTDSPLNTKPDREKMTQIMFESFNVPFVNVTNQSSLALFSAGRTTGLVLDIGDTATHAVPLNEGLTVPHAILRSSVAGRSVTQYLTKLLSDKGYRFDTPAAVDIVRNLKEKLCYVALDFDQAMAQSKQTSVSASYSLPNGQAINIDIERFQAPEVLFKPYWAGIQDTPVHELAYNSIMKGGSDLRRPLYENILIVGGGTFSRGFADRLKSELSLFAPGSVKVNVINTPERNYASWIGGASITANADTGAIWISRAEYNEVGPTIVHRKCF